jgi:hypothetical protein
VVCIAAHSFYARDVMRQVEEDVRFRSRTWLAGFLMIDSPWVD